MDEPALYTLGKHLQTLRQRRGWSLSQLAARAGIAKSNLSRLEQGDGNPTLDTLWRLAIQLDIPFGALVAPITATLGEAGVRVQLLDRGHDIPAVDAYWMHCEPDTERLAAPHSPGTQETICMIGGSLAAGPVESLQTLGAGDRHTFAADRPHAYRTTHEAATFLVTIVYAGGQQP
ncbi:XRE family transcriptional regulator [Modicisalibacter coralii]|uniref:XRE family transcriptional regulator n=1 Tax=Modicisalibacter coralii TaxID=2304602 RepID=UPI00100A329D|nr:XRE family transcriptional regulator [Halomonas coralii]